MVPAPLVTGQIFFGGSATFKGKYLQLAIVKGSAYMHLTYNGSGVSSNPSTFVFKAGQQPSRADNVNHKLWVMGAGGSSGALAFIDGDGASLGGVAVTCNVYLFDVVCQDQTGTLTQMYICGSWLQLGVPGLDANSGCEPITWAIAH
jgi:hypothetical protein